MDSNGGVNDIKCSSSSSLASLSSTSMSGSSLISPMSLPSGSVDLYGRRRQMLRVQSLEREIALLQDELKSVEGIQAASRCCKELDDFVMRANADPLILPLGQEAACVSRQWWKRLRRKLCCEAAPTVCCFCCCSCSGNPSSCLSRGRGCIPETTCRTCHCCLRTVPSCSGNCKFGACSHSCCL